MKYNRPHCNFNAVIKMQYFWEHISCHFYAIRVSEYSAAAEIASMMHQSQKGSRTELQRGKREIEKRKTCTHASRQTARQTDTQAGAAEP